MERYTVDTHALIWHLADLPFISKNAAQCLDKADDGDAFIIVPTIVLAEALFLSKKKRFAFDYAALISQMATSTSYSIYPFDFEILLQLEKLDAIPELHDRIIVATALVTSSTRITKDQSIISSRLVPTVW